jgi:protein tyrosine phosphatase
VFDATFNNISVISWQSVLLVKETGIIVFKCLSFLIADVVIGVHCTHGVNRTGYIVCRSVIFVWFVL